MSSPTSTRTSLFRGSPLGSTTRSVSYRTLARNAPTVLNLKIELEALADPSCQHYAYYDLNSTVSFIAALDSLEAYIEAEGPFDGVMAYSQGAGLVAMLLVRRQYLKPLEAPLFRCAILFSPVQVYDPVAYLERGEAVVLDRVASGMSAIPIPIVIIYGEVDERKNECLGLQGICDPNLLSVFVHEGGHEVPGMGVKGEALRETVKMARRGITRAELAVVA
ncbi:serine hydrolase-domain-containing protein [Talaromyces proteolyticus]|uniref:Serine hydrolase-domain-containing protein n=1 Tax=Talaromyces proteolyticus TaxID=1131652 RepID=A0AAD4KWN2_9EURO|nr:serine hydrolase-domain-containing protein [Talaromyces proteolyticus]KAH8702537.1 serine hydrolase-domain-containing protein [Talaromyces proteolyticus]